MEKIIEQGNPKEVARHLQKNTSSIGTVSTTDSSARREISDRTDLFDGRSKEQIRKKEYQLIKKTHFEGKTVFQFHIYMQGMRKERMFFRICQSKLKKVKSLQLSEQMEVENQRFFLVW